LRPKDTVRRGYNQIASLYRATRSHGSKDVQLIHLLKENLPQRAMVLDAGCGSGYPVTQLLAKSFEVTGVDFAIEQVRLAIKGLPGAGLVCADVTSLPFRDSTFDAVVSYYTIIHIPRTKHQELLLDFRRILKRHGFALLCMGAGDLPSDVSNYHGTQMFWSHYDSETNLRIMRDCQFTILWSGIVKDPTSSASSHLFVFGQK